MRVPAEHRRSSLREVSSDSLDDSSSRNIGVVREPIRIATLPVEKSRPCKRRHVGRDHDVAVDGRSARQDTPKIVSRFLPELGHLLIRTLEGQAPKVGNTKSIRIRPEGSPAAPRPAIRPTTMPDKSGSGSQAYFLTAAEMSEIGMLSATFSGDSIHRGKAPTVKVMIAQDEIHRTRNAGLRDFA